MSRRNGCKRGLNGGKLQQSETWQTAAVLGSNFADAFVMCRRFAWEDAQAIRKLMKRREQTRTKLNRTDHASAATARDRKTFTKSVTQLDGGGKGSMVRSTGSLHATNDKQARKSDRKHKPNSGGSISRNDQAANQPISGKHAARASAEREPRHPAKKTLKAPKRRLTASLASFESNRGAGVDSIEDGPKSKRSRRSTAAKREEQQFDQLVNKYRGRLNGGSGQWG